MDWQTAHLIKLVRTQLIHLLRDQVPKAEYQQTVKVWVTLVLINLRLIYKQNQKSILLQAKK